MDYSGGQGPPTCPPEKKTRLDPTSEAEIKRRSNKRLCEKLKQKRHDKLWVNYPEDEKEEVEYHLARFLTCTE